MHKVSDVNKGLLMFQGLPHMWVLIASFNVFRVKDSKVQCWNTEGKNLGKYEK